jgi:arabinofuranosyltransferase
LSNIDLVIELVWRHKAFWVAVVLVLAAVILVRTAWMCDDAFITLRVIDNFVNGYGLTWNIDERVQAYTHPLWLFLLTPFYALTRDAFFTPIIISILVTLAALFLLSLRQFSKDNFLFIFSAAVLLLSKAFIDYSTSGLENPLSYVLVLVFLAVLFSRLEPRGKILPATFAAALLGLNRLDLLLIVLPPLVYLYIGFARTQAERRLSRMIKAALLGFSPLLAWFVFSIVYYGFPLPNTYYAKLEAGVPLIQLARQGLNYLIFTTVFDPLTILFIAVGVIAGIVSLKAERMAVAIGILLYLAYIIRIGGDFMVGRFFAVPLVAAVALLAVTEMPVLARAGLLAAALVLGLALPDATLLSDENISYKADGTMRPARELFDKHGICNERVFWYKSDGLLINLLAPDKTVDSVVKELGKREIEPPRADGKIRTESIVIAGKWGYLLGPNYHLVDVHALSDPLLARLPIQSLGWRIGHFWRKLPEGYLNSIENGDIRIVSPYLAEYYSHLRKITQGEIFSLDRFAEIWAMNTGAYDHLIQQYRYNADLVEVDQYVRPREDVHSPVTRVIEEGGLSISLNGLFHNRKLRIGLDRNDSYRIEFYRHEHLLWSVSLGPTSGGKGIIHYDVDVPPRIADRGYRMIKVVPEQGDGRYYMGGIEFLEDQKSGGSSEVDDRQLK